MRWKRDLWGKIEAKAASQNPPVDPMKLIRHAVMRAIGEPTAEDRARLEQSSLDSTLVPAEALG